MFRANVIVVKPVGFLPCQRQHLLRARREIVHCSMSARGCDQFLPVTLKSGGPKPANSVRNNWARSKSRWPDSNAPWAAYWMDRAALR